MTSGAHRYRVQKSVGQRSRLAVAGRPARLDLGRHQLFRRERPALFSNNPSTCAPARASIDHHLASVTIRRRNADGSSTADGASVWRRATVSPRSTTAGAVRQSPGYWPIQPHHANTLRATVRQNQGRNVHDPGYHSRHHAAGGSRPSALVIRKPTPVPRIANLGIEKD